MIKIEHIYKSFEQKEVLSDISASFRPGKCSLIIGQSGSGKTTLIKCMVGSEEPDSGNILYDGRNFAKMTFKERIPIRKEVGMLFQGSALFDSLSVEENVMFPLNMFTEMQYKEKRDRVNFCLSRVKLENVNKKYPSEISGGMKKRVGIARAIVMQPKYLYCDEPNSGLDPLTSIIIDELIKEITIEYNITTIINTHDMNSVFGMGDHIIFIHKGKKWWEGSSKEIINTNNNEINEFVFAGKFIKNKIAD